MVGLLQGHEFLMQVLIMEEVKLNYLCYFAFTGDGIVRMRPTSVEPILEMKLSKEVFMGYTTVLRSEFEE